MIRPPKRKDPRGRDLPPGIFYDPDRKDYYCKPKDATGHRTTLRSKTLAGLKEVRAEFNRQKQKKLKYNSKESLNHYFDLWYAQRKANMGDSVRYNSMSSWDKHIRDKLGKTKVTEIKASDCSALLLALSETHSAATVKKIKGLLYEAFNFAAEDLVIEVNPMESRTVKQAMSDISKKGTKKDRSAPKLEEEAKLLEALSAKGKDLLYWKVVFLLHTGLRYAEFCGLTWDDINMEEHVLSVERELQYEAPEKGQPKRWKLEKKGKTAAAIRKVYLDAQAREALTKIKELSPKCIYSIDGITDFVSVGTRSGKPTPESTFHEGVSARIKNYNASHPEETPLRMLSPHLYRHGYGSRQTEAGVNPAAVAKGMGHKDATFTLKTYVQTDETWALEELRKNDSE